MKKTPTNGKLSHLYVRCSPELIVAIDAKRGLVPLSAWVRHTLAAALGKPGLAQELKPGRRKCS